MNKSVKKTITQLEKGLDITNIQLAEALKDVENTGYVTEATFEEALEGKADLVGGKVPAEQLPSYVDDVVNFESVISYNGLKGTIGNIAYKDKLFFVSTDPYKNKFINTKDNTAESDWEIIDPEDGKIYINITDNHSYRWTGSTLVDLDKQFSDDISELQKQTKVYSFNNCRDILDISTARTLPSLSEMFSDIKNRTADSITIYWSDDGIAYSCAALYVQRGRFNESSISFSIINNKVSLFDTYTQSHYQTYKITREDTNEYSIKRTKDEIVVHISDITTYNRLAVEDLTLNKTYSCTISTGSEYMIGTCTKSEDPNITYCVVNYNNKIRYYNVDNTTGVLTLVTNLNISDALYYDAYQLAGGTKTKADVYSEMAAAFGANWVTLDYSKLGTTLADDIAEKVANASAAILTNNPNSTFPEFYLSKQVGHIVYFSKVRRISANSISSNQFTYNTNTKGLSVPSISAVANPVQYYQDNGGTKTASEFLRDYMGAFTPNYFTISRSLLNTTLSDSNFTGVSNASILILEPSGEDTTPRVFIRGGYNADEVRFQEVSHSSNNYIAVRAIVLTKATKALSAEQTNVIKGGNSVYEYYTSAGGTKTEDEFKTAFVNLIDNGGSGGGTQVYDLGSKTVPDAGPYDITAFNGTEFGVQLREIVLNTVDGTPLLIKYQIVEERDGTHYNRQIGAIPTHTYDGRLQLLTVDKEKPVILDLQGEQVDEGVYDYSFAVTELAVKA